MLKIMIYTEGGFRLGLGHVYRTLSLAKELESRNANINFITTSEPYVCDLISSRGFNFIQKKDPDSIKEEIIKAQPQVVVIDKLSVDEKFAIDIKPYLEKLIIFGNVSPANKHADVVVNAIIGTDYENKAYKDDAGTLYLKGPKYLVLRDEFYKNAGKYVYTGEINRILMTFGGTDQADFSRLALENITSSDYSGSIDILIGAGYKYRATLDEIINKNSGITIRLHENISNMSEFMLNTDFILTSPGTTIFEAFFLKVPVLSFFQNESQKEIFGKFYQTTDFDRSLDLYSCIKDQYNNYNDYLKNLMKIETGEGKEDILSCIGEKL